MQDHLHIISFDIPYPANYGGAIDVFHKIRCLYNAGIKIILHCFEYGGRSHAKALEALCEHVYYYKRDTSISNHLSFLPYNVKSRINSELKENLLKDNFPILFEVLHTCYLLDDPDLKDRKKLFRHSNIEHDYFRELARAERSLLKKGYLYAEAYKLKRFETQIIHADEILAVSEEDLRYFRKYYPVTPSHYLPSFHEYDDLNCKTGKGNYVLYHGNLSISENYVAAEWLIDHVFSKIHHPVIIAGLNPPKHLTDRIRKFSHITLKENCSAKEMQELISNAHIHCLYTEQATGLKLKLLNVLYSGRFVVANTNMVAGTRLAEACKICDTAEKYIETINHLFEKEFNEQKIAIRKQLIATMNNAEKTQKLIALIS